MNQGASTCLEAEDNFGDSPINSVPNPLDVHGKEENTNGFSELPPLRHDDRKGMTTGSPNISTSDLDTIPSTIQSDLDEETNEREASSDGDAEAKPHKLQYTHHDGHSVPPLSSNTFTLFREGHRLELKSHITIISLLQREGHQLWFSHPHVEHVFVYFSTIKSGYRFLGMHLGLAAGGILRLLLSSKDDAFVSFGAIALIVYTIVASVVFGIAQRKLQMNLAWRQQQLASGGRADGGDSHKLQLGELLPLDGDENSERIVKSTLEMLRTNKRPMIDPWVPFMKKHLSEEKKEWLRLALVCERVAIAADLLNAVVVMVIFISVQGTCPYIDAFDNRADHERCPYRIHSFSILVRLFPLLTGTPRFVWHVVINVIFVILWWSAAHFHQTNTETTILTKGIYLGFAVLASCLKWLDERSQRSDFATQCLAEHQMSLSKQRSEALRFLIVAATPKQLHARFGGEERIGGGGGCGHDVQADLSTKAVCLIISIADAQHFMTSMPPIQAVMAVSEFNATVLECSKGVPHLCRIRTVGDHTYFVGNLFPTPQGKKEPLPLHVIHNSIELVVRTKQRTKIAIRAGIGAGCLVGTAMGVQFSRYDMFGPALEDAIEVLALCKPNHYHVSDTASAMCTTDGSDDDERMTSSASFALPQHEHAANNNNNNNNNNNRELPLSRSLFSDQFDGMVETKREIDDVPQQVLSNLLSATDTTSASSKTSAATPGSVSTKTDHHAVVSVATQQPEPDLDSLSLKASMCCCGALLEFDSEAAEQAWQEHTLEVRGVPFAMVNGVMCMLTVLMLLTLLADRRSSLDVPTYCSVVILFVVAISFGGAAGMALRRVPTNDPLPVRRRHGMPNDNNTHKNHQITTTNVILCRVTFMILVAGVQLSRPSVIGDDTFYVTCISMVAQLYLLSVAKATLVFQFFLVALHFLFLFHRPLINIAQLLMIPVSVAVIYVSALHYNSNKRLFVQLCELQRTHRDVHRQELLRQRMVNAFVPTCFLHKITWKAMKRNRIDCTSMDDCIVIDLWLHPMWVSQKDSGGCIAKSFSNDGEKNNNYNQIASSFEYTMGAAASSTTTSSFSGRDRQFKSWLQAPGVIKEFNAASAALIETIVGAVPHKSLHTVSIFGGNVVIAGPLKVASGGKDKNTRRVKATMDVSGGRMAPANGSTSTQHQLLTMTSSSTVSPEATAEDTAHFLAALLSSNPNDSEAARKRSVDYTCGVSYEQVVSALRLNVSPSFDILGPAVGEAHALRKAVPVLNNIAVTAKTATLLATTATTDESLELRRCNVANIPPVAISENINSSTTVADSCAAVCGLHFKPEESWSLRNFGPRRVRLVELAQERK